MWLVLCKFPIVFSTVKLKLGTISPNSSIDSKLGLWNFGLKLHLRIFSNSHTDRKLAFLNVVLAGLLNFSQFMKESENWVF